MDEDIKKLLEKNLALTEEIYQLTKKIKRNLSFQRLVSIFYLIIIVAPIILGLIYLPPLLKDLFSQYQGLLGIQAGAGNPIESLINNGVGNLDLGTLDVNKLPANLREMIK